MQEFTNWTIETIREDNLLGSWLEERKFEWIPLTSNSIHNMIDNRKSVLIITDREREWYLEYILSKINHKSLKRPILPFFNANSFIPNIDIIKTEIDIELIHDMLGITFPNGYFFWYIGTSTDKKATLAKMSKQPLLWVMDEELSNSFLLKSKDDSLDMRLLNMYRLFDKTLSAVLFAQIDVTK